jgi:hypothetical protein
MDAVQQSGRRSAACMAADIHSFKHCRSGYRSAANGIMQKAEVFGLKIPRWPGSALWSGFIQALS